MYTFQKIVSFRPVFSSCKRRRIDTSQSAPLPKLPDSIDKLPSNQMRFLQGFESPPITPCIFNLMLSLAQQITYYKLTFIEESLIRNSLPKETLPQVIEYIDSILGGVPVFFLHQRARDILLRLDTSPHFTPELESSILCVYAKSLGIPYKNIPVRSAFLPPHRQDYVRLFDLSRGLFTHNLESTPSRGGYPINSLHSFLTLFYASGLDVFKRAPLNLELLICRTMLLTAHHELQHLNIFNIHSYFSFYIQNPLSKGGPVLIPLSHFVPEYSNSHCTYLLLHGGLDGGFLGNRGFGSEFHYACYASPSPGVFSRKITPFIFFNLQKSPLLPFLKTFLSYSPPLHTFDAFKTILQQTSPYPLTPFKPNHPTFYLTYQSQQKGTTCYLHSFKHILSMLFSKPDYNLIMTAWRTQTIDELMALYSRYDSASENARSILKELNRIETTLSDFLKLNPDLSPVNPKKYHKYKELQETVSKLKSFLFLNKKTP